VKDHANVINKSQSSGKRKLLTIHTGECFGEMAVITHAPRKNDIIAGSDCYVANINAATIDSFEKSMQLKLHKQFSENLINRLLSSGSAKK
jgi:CRP-like cAMP-binding protein|tara:strand:- start:22 stop:294 length:273 start_codon:yes stop_codon:yes gene_type:complete